MKYWISESETETSVSHSGGGVNDESSEDIAVLAELLCAEAKSAYGKLPKDYGITEYPSYFNVTKY